MRWPAPATVRWTILVLLLALWEFVPTTGLLPELFLPALSKTLTVLYIDRHIYFAALLVTLYEVAFSMLIACGLGILVGAVVGTNSHNANSRTRIVQRTVAGAGQRIESLTSSCGSAARCGRAGARTRRLPSSRRCAAAAA